MREDNYPSPVSDPQAEGLPETADDDSTAWDDVETGRQADGPDPAALPADHPTGMDLYGITPAEARTGESLDYKLAREAADADPGRAPVASQGDDVELVDAELDAPGPEAVLPDEPSPAPDRSPVSLYDRPDIGPATGAPVGRLVEPDEGAHPDDEKDAVARDEGSAGGGASAEELAMHEVTEP
jgi:uncharacterized protein DUF5709